MKKLLLSLPLLTLGCAPLPEAPGELDDLNNYLFLEFDNADERVPAAGLANLKSLLEGTSDRDFDLGSNWRDNGWQEIEALAAESWGSADYWAEADPADQLGAAVAVRSNHPPAEHGGLVGDADQTPYESDSSASYDRTFDTDLACFDDRSCDQLDTSNAVRRSNFLLTVDYTTPKQYRWVELPDEGGTALLARSWLSDSFVGENGNNTMRQFSSLEVYLPRGEGSWAYLALWADIDWAPPAPDEDLQINTAGSGVQQGFQNSECALEGLERGCELP